MLCVTQAHVAEGSTIGRFLAKSIFFAVTLAGLLLGLEKLLTALTPWSRYEDPRTRILWDNGPHDTRIVLLGGSAFASLYVQSLSDVVWTRLEAYSGQPVFPGALNGARPADFVAAAIHVSREWPEATTVFIGVPPTLFAVTRSDEPPKGNFADAFFNEYGIDAMDQSPMRHVQGYVYRWVFRPFLAVRTRSTLANLVDRPRPPGWMHHRVWSEEERPKELFRFFEHHLVIDKGPRPFGWLQEAVRRLKEAGMQPVVVLTPLNPTLVRSFATLYPANAILHSLRRNVTIAKTHLERDGTPIIDLTDGCPTQCFFDIVHVNTCGDDWMAKRLSEWLEQHQDLSRH